MSLRNHDGKITVGDLLQLGLVQSDSEGTLSALVVFQSALSLWRAARAASSDETLTVTFDRFVDSVNGNDSNDGLTESTPWATLSKVSALGAQAANLRIGLRAGSTFQTAISIPADYMLFGRYGLASAPKPILDGTVPGSNNGITDTRVGTQIQDIAVRNFARVGILVGAGAAGVPGGAIRRCEIGPMSTQIANGIIIQNWSGGEVVDNYIHDCWNGSAYGGGGNGNAIALQTSYRVDVGFNRIEDCYVGVIASGAGQGLHQIHHNRILRSKVNAIDMQGGASGYGNAVFNNTIHHSPVFGSGHGIDSQLASVGSVWRNNIVYCDSAGVNTDVQLFCLSPAIASLPGCDTDYNLGFIVPGSTANYGQINGTMYATFAAWKAGLVANSVAGAEAHGLNADPMFQALASGDVSLLASSRALNAGVALGYPGELYVGSVPDMGAY